MIQIQSCLPWRPSASMIAVCTIKYCILNKLKAEYPFLASSFLLVEAVELNSLAVSSVMRPHASKSGAGSDEHEATLWVVLVPVDWEISSSAWLQLDSQLDSLEQESRTITRGTVIESLAALIVSLQETEGTTVRIRTGLGLQATVESTVPLVLTDSCEPRLVRASSFAFSLSIRWFRRPPSSTISSLYFGGGIVCNCTLGSEGSTSIDSRTQARYSSEGEGCWQFEWLEKRTIAALCRFSTDFEYCPELQRSRQFLYIALWNFRGRFKSDITKYRYNPPRPRFLVLPAVYPWNFGHPTTRGF